MIVRNHHCKEQEKPIVLFLKRTGIPVINISGTTIHSGLGIKPGIKLLGLNDKSKDVFRNCLSEVKLSVIDELCMVSNDLWTDID